MRRKPFQDPFPRHFRTLHQLQACQEGDPLARILGACNTPKAALLACFREEKRVKCHVNQEKQKRFQEKLAESIEEDRRLAELERLVLEKKRGK